jgi:hypothetical protein
MGWKPQPILCSTIGLTSNVPSRSSNLRTSPHCYHFLLTPTSGLTIQETVISEVKPMTNKRVDCDGHVMEVTDELISFVGEP